MKRTYARTLLVSNLPLATVELRLYDKCKYTDESRQVDIVQFTGVTSWDLVSGEDVIELEKTLDVLDDYHEYVILHFRDSSTKVFRSSYCDMFIY